MKYNVVLPEKDSLSHETLQKLKGYPERKSPDGETLFSEEFFGIANSEVWNGLSQDVRGRIHAELSEGLLKETLHIEMAGMAYANKMGLLSQNIDQRQVFCEFASQESRHFEMICPFVSEIDGQLESEFSQFVSGIVKKANFFEGLILVQTTLEGWGLHYYQELQKNCNHEALKKVFVEILKDEAKHHSGGLAMIEKDKLTDRDLFESSFVYQTLTTMAQSIAIGPLQLAQTVFSADSQLGRAELQKFLREVEAVERAEFKMNVFKRLVSKVVQPSVVEAWQREGMFKVLAESEMANLVSLGTEQIHLPKQGPSADASL
ncbi:MAG: ferritin-like domain-containing protein [Bdellovibrionales bacterium]|nr:ferritin-like domain-containing protein [Bdellovibrionales bacterium]